MSSQIMQSGLTTFTSGNRQVVAWAANNTFLVTLLNSTFIPNIVHSVITVYLHNDGTFSKHDLSMWLQLYVSQFPYFPAIPK